MINIHEQTSFFYNKINLQTIDSDRLVYIKKICMDKKVLHVGCADSQYFHKDRNLHLMLSSICKQLDGMDIDVEILKKLNELYPAKYYTNLNDIQTSYDLVIIPEVLEHVLNVYNFLTDLFKIESKQYFITVPNCQFHCKNMIIEDTSSTETIHPDHKYWFSPYTLYNCLKPFIVNKNISIYYLQSRSIIAVLIE